MNRTTCISALAALLTIGACKGADDPTPTSTTKPSPTGSATPTKPGAPAATGADPIAAVGVEAGGLAHGDDEGPAATLAAVTGTVEIRRVGEADFAAAKADAALYPGDAVRTGDASSATVMLADESAIELAEVTTVAVASRDGSADPASGAAVLGGLARFTVTPRAPAEGAFRVYTPAGVVLTRGTTYGVGVAASGEARVGVETGVVDVIGLAALDATPVEIQGGSVAVLAAGGTVAAPVAWTTDDWGTWRDEADASIEVGAAFDGHATALGALGADLTTAYADLDASAASVAEFEASAAASAEAGNLVAYEAAAPDGAVTIDASFGVAGRVELLTWAYAAHAALATDLYVRHQAAIEARWTVAAPRVDAAVLWPKRYEVTATAYLQPLRAQYYVHHPRGRVHASLVGVTVPTFYAQATATVITPAQVRAKAKGKIWLAQELTYTAQARPVWVAAPALGWRAQASLRVAPPRAKVAWYVRPTAPKATLLVGAKVTGRFTSKLKVAAPVARGKLTAAWRVPVGVKIRVPAPDLRAAASARATLKLGAGGRLGLGGGVRVDDQRTKLTPPAADVRAELKGKLKVAVPPAPKPPTLKVKVKAPSVKVKAKGSIKGGLSLGN